jgi:hypothetical protein
MNEKNDNPEYDIWEKANETDRQLFGVDTNE